MKFVFQIVAVVSLSYVVAAPRAEATTARALTTRSPMLSSRKPKLVKFRVRNDLQSAVDLKIGEDLVTVQPGQTINVSLPVGARITVATANPDRPVGYVIVQVGSELDDATVAIKH